MIGQAGWWTQTPSAIPLQPKNEMLIFGLRSLLMIGWAGRMDSNPICHPSPAKKMKCSFLDYVQLLMIGWAGRWTQTPSTTPLQWKKWNAHFWITYNFWAGWWTRTPSANPLLPKKWNAHFWITFNFWWSARLVDRLEPCLPPLSSQKYEMFIFGLRSTSDDCSGWSMDSNPICQPSTAKKNKMLIFGLRSTSDDRPGWSMDSNPIHHPSPAKKMKCSFWIIFNFWWSARLVDGLKPHPPPLTSEKYEMLSFGLHTTSDDWLGWSMDSNPICQPSPAKKMKCPF